MGKILLFWKSYRPQNSYLFIDAFKSFNEVVVACYGKDLSPCYKDKIKIFRTCYTKLNISTTPKIHAVFYHVREFCDFVNMGLGPWKEQTSESLPSDNRRIWQNYKVRDTNH